MRTLKFRHYYEGDDDSSPEWSYFDLRQGRAVDGGWQQFTGLKDKNGVEIYEGDIIRIDSTLIKPVCWDSGGARWLFSSSRNWTDSASHYDAKDIEVIGNIMENPELLK